MLSALHDHPIIVFFSGLLVLVVLQNEKARIVAALATFIIVVLAATRILGVDLKL